MLVRVLNQSKTKAKQLKPFKNAKPSKVLRKRAKREFYRLALPVMTKIRISKTKS